MGQPWMGEIDSPAQNHRFYARHQPTHRAQPWIFRLKPWHNPWQHGERRSIKQIDHQAAWELFKIPYTFFLLNRVFWLFDVARETHHLMIKYNK